MEISKFVQFHRYLSSVSLQLQIEYPNTRLSWLTRQLHLELIFTSIISLRTANWIKWENRSSFICITYGTLRNCFSCPTMSKLTQVRDQSIKTQYSVPSAPIYRGPQQDMAPNCSNENCSARYHQACNGLSIGQTCHAKDSGRSIIWKCPQHDSGIAEVITPPAPVYEQPNRPSAVGKSCSVCMNPIRTYCADLGYHCANTSCGNVCHLATTCSGFVYPRGNARPRALSTRIWHCHLHSATPSATSPSATPHPSSLANNSPPHPTPPSLTSLLNQGLSLADAKNSKEKCAKCSAALRSNTVPVRCSVCSKGFHQKCSTGPKASTRDNLWKCEKCTNIQQNCTSQSTNRGPTNSLPSQPVPSTTRNKLKIYQWNADGIRPKLLELRDRLLNSDIDILAVQESKLRKTDKTPSIEGYATIRKDRNNILGGGLLLFIRTDIVFEKLHFLKKLARRFYLCVSKLLNHLGLISTTSIYQITQLNILRSTLP